MADSGIQRDAYRGFYLAKLADDLNQQVVCEIRAYFTRRWPRKMFGDGEPKITLIRYYVDPVL